MELGMDKPKQRLKRLPDPGGSSAGWWAIQGWPGLVVARIDQGWSFYFHPQTLWPSQAPIAYHELERSESLYRRHKLHACKFQTRREALRALQVILESGLGA